MTRNKKMRFAADKLPSYPKVINGKVQHDGYGHIIYVDHFKEIKRIKKESGDKGVMNYLKTVRSFEENRKYNLSLKEMRNAKIRRRTVFVSVSIILIALVFTYLNNQEFFKGIFDLLFPHR